MGKVVGKVLDLELVACARQVGMYYVHTMGVYTRVPREHESQTEGTYWGVTG